MKKKILCVLAICATVLTFSALTACKGNGTTDPPDDKPPVVAPPEEITVQMTETLDVNLFRSAKLTAVTNSEEDVVYESSDTTVLTVDAASGKITPLKAGTATVTARVEGKSATCSVTVTAPAQEELSVVALNTTLNIKTAASATIEAQAFYLEEELEGVTYSFVSSAPEIVTVNETTGEVRGVDKGTAEITVTGTAKGVTLGSDTVTVNVTEDVSVTANLTSVTLYTAAGEEGTFATSADLTVEVKVNDGVIAEPQFTVVSDNEEVVTYESGKLVAAGKKGAATVTVSYVSALGTPGNATVAVTVLYPEKTVTADAVIVGINRGFVDYTPSFEIETLGKAYINGEEYPVTYEEGVVRVGLNGVPSGEQAVDVQIIADSAGTTYKIDFGATVYDFLIGTREEFVAFANALNTTNYVYALLTANVDMENGTIATANNPADCSGDGKITSFSLDGNGFSVLNLSSNGLRGAFAARVGKNAAGKDSVIKNIAFANFNALTANAGGLFMTVGDVTFENFFLSVKVNYMWGSPIALWGDENVTYQNTVVYCIESADPNRTETGNFCKIGALTSEISMDGRDATQNPNPNPTKNYTNTYAINAYARKMILGSVHIESRHQPWETEAQARDYWVDDGVTVFTEGLYANWADFRKDFAELPAGFDSAIWKFNADGELVFQTMPEPEKPTFEYLPEITGEENVKLFHACSNENTVEWLEAEQAYSFTRNTSAENDTRGFYIDFDYFKGARELGATKISFTLITNVVGGGDKATYISFATNEAGASWYDNLKTFGTTVWGNVSQTITLDLTNIPEGTSLFILMAPTGSFKLSNIRVNYPKEYEYLPEITGAENVELFHTGNNNNSNTVEWLENEQAYLFTNNLADGNERGFFIDLDYFKGAREKGATKISFTITTTNITVSGDNSTYISFVTNEACSDWWDNRNLGTTVWGNVSQTITLDLTNIPEGATLFILMAPTGSFKLSNITIEYPQADPAQ